MAGNFRVAAPGGAAWLRDRIGTPVQAHRVNSEAEYRTFAKQMLAALGGSADLREMPDRVVPHVSDGRWVVDCACGNGASAHPGDGTEAWPAPIAVCCECGAVHRPIFPADRERAEAVLLARPSPFQRHWFPDASHLTARRGVGRPETVADLEAENRANGARVPRKGR